MSKSFSAMKKSRMGFQELATKIESEKGKKFAADERLYYPERDKSGNAFAVIRFLPAAAGEEVPWVKKFSHGFNVNGKWFIEDCPTTTEQDCPVCSANSVLWNSGIESNKAIVRERKRRLKYFSNILVVEDSKNPDNEGKVFLFGFGAKIFNKIMEAISPEFDDETPINPFDFWEGANFRLKIRKVDGQVNYDKSDFDDISPIAKTEKEMEAIWNKQHKLQDEIADDKFKSYAELKSRFDFVVDSEPEQESEQAYSTEQVKETPVKRKPERAVEATPAPNWNESESSPASEDLDEAMEFFEKLADGD